MTKALAPVVLGAPKVLEAPILLEATIVKEVPIVLICLDLLFKDKKISLVKLKQFARLKGIGFKGKHNKEHFIKAIEEFLKL
jgi:hypothetical protein